MTARGPTPVYSIPHQGAPATVAPPLASLGAAEPTATQGLVRELVIHALATCEPGQAVKLVAQGLQRLVGCRLVAFGVADGTSGRMKLAAVSHTAQFDPKSELAAVLETALRETATLDGPFAWTPATREPAAAATACQRLATVAAAVDHAHVHAGVVKDSRGERLGGWLAVGDAQALDPQRIRLLHEAADPLAALLHVTQHAQQHAASKKLYGLGHAWRSRRRGIVAVALLVLAGGLAIPAPFTLKCDCTIEPVTRRFVAAPFDGLLLKTNVRPGDRVQAGDVLAQMDGQELRLQLASLHARAQQARQRYDSALAKRDSAAIQIEQAEMRQLESELEQVQSRVRHLEIRSPLEGVVVAGDLKRAEGVPITAGQRLFEVAPLHDLVAEVAIPEAEVNHVAPGQEVSVSLEAATGTIPVATVERIHPRAEQRDANSVFIAEAPLAGTEGQVLPGMKGRARIAAGSRSVAWILFHRPVQSLWHVLGW